MRAFEQLIQHWRTEGLIVVPGVAEEETREFETRHDVALPPDFRKYLSHVNGMAQIGGQDCDGKYFAFWPLHRIKPVPQECAENKAQVPVIENVDAYFAFADYMQWSWAYAICLASKQRGKILQFGTLSPRIVANSFTEFVEAYVRDSEQLYIPRAPRVANR